MKWSIKEFEAILPSICGSDTTLDPNGWTPQNPLWGHCAVVSLLAQELFGGELMRASLENTDFADMRSHYWNKIENGSEKDFTSPQFGDVYPEGLEPEVRTREYLLSNDNTRNRYELLKKRLLSLS